MNEKETENSASWNDDPRVFWKWKTRFRKLTPFSYFTPVFEERQRKQSLAAVQAQEAQKQKEAEESTRRKEKSDKKKERQLAYGTDGAVNTLLIPEFYVFTPVGQDKPSIASGSVNLGAVLDQYNERRKLEAEQAKFGETDLSELDEEELLIETNRRKQEEEERRKQEEKPFDIMDVVKELRELLADCPVFYLNKHECFRQLVFTIHTWERDKVIGAHITRLKQELRNVETDLKTVEAELYKYTSVYSFKL